MTSTGGWNAGNTGSSSGPNGAGKTTLVKMILGMAWPLFGAEVCVLGNRYGACDITEVRKKVAWASPFLQAWTADTSIRWKTIDVALSGLDSTVGFYRKASGEEMELALSALERIGAKHLADRYFDRLSSGEQIKALIARALIAKPELVILDETCVYLDLRSREFLLEAIDALAAAENSSDHAFHQLENRRNHGKFQRPRNHSRQRQNHELRDAWRRPERSKSE